MAREFDAPSDVQALARRRAMRAGARTAPGGGGPAPAPAPAARMISLGPPELVMYDQASAIYQEGRAAGIVTGAAALLAEYQLPPGLCAVVNSLVIGGVNLTTGMDIEFALQINGGPWPGMTRSLPPQGAAAAFMSWGPDELLVRVPAGALISLVARVVAGGPVDASGQFAGWEYPQELRDAYAHVWRP